MALDFVYLKNATDEVKSLRHPLFNQASYVSTSSGGIVKTVGSKLDLAPGEAAKIPYVVFNDNMRNKSFERISEEEFDKLAGVVEEINPEVTEEPSEEVNTEVNEEINEEDNTEVDTEVDEETGKEASNFVCSKCGKSCASKAGLSAHERNCNN